MALARKMVATGKLTEYQAAVVLEQRSDPLLIDRYIILNVLGSGGMGRVFKALHKPMERFVALKVLRADAIDSPERVERFHREVKAAARLTHPNIVTAHDGDESAGIQFLVMEYIEGLNLAQLVKRHGPLPAADACELVRQAALGLQAVHEAGLVHRDIKPSNLMLTPAAEVKIFDLGLALIQDVHAPASTELTSTNQIMGTLGYLAPEQCSDPHNVDIRADIYSVAATLYNLLAGEAPFADRKASTFGQQVKILMTDTPTTIAKKRSDLPADLIQLIDSSLAIEPDTRPGNPREVARALEMFALGHDLTRLTQAVEPAATESDLAYETQIATKKRSSPPSGKRCLANRYRIRRAA